MWAIVPLKSPQAAKSRLSGVLSADARRSLFFELAQRVIDALHATPGITRVAVVTASEEVEPFARRLGAEVLRQPRDDGTASAFAFAIEQLRPRALDRVLMIAADLPLVTPASLRRLVAAADAGAAIVLAPDRERVGTNAMLCAPPDAIAPCFGVDSFPRHLAAAEAKGLSAWVLQLDELSLDLDVAADLDHLRQLREASRHPVSADAPWSAPGAAEACA